MTDQQIRLHFGELNAAEMRLARAIVGWYERQIEELKKWDRFKEQAVDNVMRILPELNTSPSWEDAANNARALIDNMKADQAKLRAAADGLAEALERAMGIFGPPDILSESAWVTTEEIDKAWNGGQAALTTYQAAKP
jgi:hypothetical protein